MAKNATPLSPLPEQTAIMIMGHGSRSPDAINEFTNMVMQLKKRYESTLPASMIEYGFLEFATPIIREGLEKLRLQKAKKILAVPALLFAAGHAKNDMPSVVNLYQQQQPEVIVHYGRELAIDFRLLQAAGEIIQQSLPSFTSDDEKKKYLAETILVVVGRGTSDPDANSNIAKVMRFLWEGFGFGWGEVAYSGVTFPLTAVALDRIVHLPFKRIIVFPYFLFSGILVNRIYQAVDSASQNYPNIEFIKTKYLNDHPLVLDTITSRINEIIEGQGVMNCQLCKYRNQILGFETEVGLPQESHHHHVEGIGTHHHEHHHHSENHHHDGGHHHPYPFHDHPLGPSSLKK